MIMPLLNFNYYRTTSYPRNCYSSPDFLSTLYKLSIYLFSCPAGWISTEEGSCTDDNECTSDPCNNGGTCINFDNGQGFLCMCPTGYMGDICHLPVQEKMISVANGAYWVIVFVLINVIGKNYILTCVEQLSQGLSLSPSSRSIAPPLMRHYHILVNTL